MTEAGKTTLERAQEFIADKNVKDGGWTWPGSPPITKGDLANFADSLTAELQKENERLREALENISNCLVVPSCAQCEEIARAALEVVDAQ